MFPSFPSVQIDRLKFEKQAVLDQHIKPERFLENEPLVFNADDALVDRHDLAKLQFADEAFLVNALDKPRTFETVNLDGGTNDRVAQ